MSIKYVESPIVIRLLGHALEVLRFSLDLPNFLDDWLVDEGVEGQGEQAADEVTEQPHPAIGNGGPTSQVRVLNGQSESDCRVDEAASVGRKGSSYVVEDGDAEVPGKLAFYESGVGVGKQKSKQYKDKYAHRFVGQDAENASIQGQLLHFLVTQNIADGYSCNSTQQLGRQIAKHHLRLVLALLLETVGKRDDWVDVRPAKTAANSDRDKQQACSLHIIPRTGDSAQVPESKQKDSETFKHKDLQARCIVHDAELIMLEPAQRTFLETLRSLELVLQFLIEQRAIDFLFEGHASEIQVDYQGIQAILVSFQLDFDAMQQ